MTGFLQRLKKLPDRNGKAGGTIFTLDLEDGTRVCYGAPTILLEALEGVDIGTEVYIKCTGKVPSSRGQDAWAFDFRTRE